MGKKKKESNKWYCYKYAFKILISDCAYKRIVKIKHFQSWAMRLQTSCQLEKSLSEIQLISQKTQHQTALWLSATTNNPSENWGETEPWKSTIIYYHYARKRGIFQPGFTQLEQKKTV